MKNYILAGLISILVVFGVVVSIKCSNLEKENLKLKQENITILDSIKIENKNLNKEIEDLNIEILNYKTKIDSLKTVKQQIVIQKEYIISESLIEGVELLKENLKCER